MPRLVPDALVVEAEYADFDNYWQPFLTGTGTGTGSGTGPRGAYSGSLDARHRAALHGNAPGDSVVPTGPSRSARAWGVRGVA